MTTILSFILVIGVLVFFHELGHFLAAKSVGVRVEKFYLGFNFFGLGWKKVYNGTEYGIGLFPLGGYVKLAGIIDESMDVEYTGAPDEFHSKNTLGKIWIMSAGVIMNFLLAILIFSHLTYYNGIEEPDPRAIVGQVLSGHPSETLGLLEGDEILSINGIEISNWVEMTREIRKRPKEEINISWIRDGYVMVDSVMTSSYPDLIGYKSQEQGAMGIYPAILDHREAKILESLTSGCKLTFYWLDKIYRGIIALLIGNVSIKEMAGPIMIAKMAGHTASVGGINALLGLMAIISINLGLINLIPLPGLDGGHVLIALIEGVSRRNLPIKVKLGIQQAGLLLILMLFIIIMINDIQRLFL